MCYSPSMVSLSYLHLYKHMNLLDITDAQARLLFECIQYWEDDHLHTDDRVKELDAIADALNEAIA